MYRDKTLDKISEADIDSTLKGCRLGRKISVTMAVYLLLI